MRGDIIITTTITGRSRRRSSHHNREDRPSSSRLIDDSRSHHSSSHHSSSHHSGSHHSGSHHSGSHHSGSHHSSSHHSGSHHSSSSRYGDDHYLPLPPQRRVTTGSFPSTSSNRDGHDHYTPRAINYYDSTPPPTVRSYSHQSFEAPRRSHTDPTSHPGPAPRAPSPPPVPGPGTAYYPGPGSTFSRASSHHTSGPQTWTHGRDRFIYNPPPGGPGFYRPSRSQYTPPRATNEAGEEVIRPTSIWEPDSDNEGSTRSSPTPLFQTEETLPKNKTDEQPLKDVEPEAPDEPAPRYLRKFREAQEKGKMDEQLLKFTINVILLYEWFMEDRVLSQYHPDHFETAIKVIPVRYMPNRNGHYQPVRNRKKEWDIVTDYTPEYNIYLAAILIRVPMILDRITPSMIRNTYDRFTIKPRTEMLKELDIPFRDSVDYRKYAMVFQFEGGDAPTQLYSANLADDAVILIPRRIF